MMTMWSSEGVKDWRLGSTEELVYPAINRLLLLLSVLRLSSFTYSYASKVCQSMFFDLEPN